MKVKEAIKLINEESLDSLWDVEDILPRECTELAEGLELDEHRWYSYATNYYQCEDGIIGIRGAYQSFSELQMWSDIACDNGHCEAFEAEEYTTISYRRKED